MIKAVGIGDYVIDRYYHYGLMFPGGNALNFAVYSKQLGCDSAFVGVLADDKFADVVTRAIDERGIDRSRCVRAHGDTWLCSTRLENGERTISDDNDGGVVKNQPLKVDEDLLAYVRGFDIVHANINGSIDDEIGKLKTVGVPIIYDYSDLWESEADLLKMCPHIDFAFFSGKKLPQNELKRLLTRLVENGCELAICTIGKQGSIAYDGNKYYTKKPYNLEGAVVDTLGAGDSFLTGFIISYIEGCKRLQSITAGEPGKICTAEDVRSYREGLIEYSMQVGNLLAIKNCMVLGAFGQGVALEE
jgi:sugar/nucleoside kinase (ribokinase family)